MRNSGSIRGIVAAVALAAAAIAGGVGDLGRQTAAAAAPAASGVPAETAAGAPALDAYRDLPIAFVQNAGQIDDRVRFYVQGSRSAFFFTRDGIVISLGGGPAASDSGEGRDAARLTAPEIPLPAGRGAALALRFLGADRGVAIEGREPAPGRVHYLRGSDPARWHTDLPRFAEVVYRDLWPGIDLAVRGKAAELKYEFRVRPGARASDIRLAYDGADSLAVADDGALLVGTAAGIVRDAAPVSWQKVNGLQVPVSSRYALADGSYGFALGPYDPGHELIIDPGLDYSTFLGGSSMDRAGGIAVDSNGSTYVVGTTQSTDFPATSGAFDRTMNGGTTDVFVAKLDPTGSGLVYATYLGGTPTPLRRGGGDNVEFGRAIAVDGNGHAYVTGLTDSSDFPTTSGAFQPTLNATPDDARDAFVVKLNPSGSGLVYGTFLGGSGFDDGWSIAVDSNGQAYVTGDTGSTDFPTTTGAAQTARGGGRDAFAVKFDASGSALVYSTYLGGLDNEIANGIAVDAAGHAYVAGGTRSADFPTSPGAFQPVHSGGTFENLFEAFVAKLDGAGALVYSTFLGGTRIDRANAVAVDAHGRAYVVGATSSEEFPTTEGAFDRTSRGSFAARLAVDGSGLEYSTFLGGGGSAALAVDGENTAWITGTAGAAAPTTADAFARETAGGSDAWLGRLNADGSAILFGTFLGGVSTDNGIDVTLGSTGEVYLTGTTLSFDFPTTAGAFDTTFAGDPLIFWGDAFVARFGSGSGTVTPPPDRTTSSFSGRLDKGQARIHSVQVGSAGPVDLSLGWNESRTNVTLRVRDWSGALVFSDTSTARPKEGSFNAQNAGRYDVEVANPGDRRTDYTLAVTHPIATTTPAGVSFLSLDPTTVTGGASSTGFVALSAAAPPGGAAVALSSSNTSAAAVPPSVTIPAGQTSASFSVATNSVASNTSSTIAATYNGTSRSATLNVNADGGATMSSLTLDPTAVQGGGTSTGTATLTAPAPPGGAVVSLVSSNTSVATVPPGVTIPAGDTATTFTVSTSPQEFNQSSAISASHGGVTRTVILSVSAGAAPALSALSVSPAAVQGGTSSTGTATLTAAAPAGGLEVALSSSHPAASVPARVTIPQGATAASFSITTSSVDSPVDVTVAGSAGGVTRTATLTVNPPAAAAVLTVTATGRSGERVLSSPAGIDVSVGSTGSASFESGTSITLSVTDDRDAFWSGACSSGDRKTRTCTFTLNGDASVTANVQ